MTRTTFTELDKTILVKNSDNKSNFDAIILLEALWKKRLRIIFTTVVFVAYGLFLAFTSEDVYTASSTFIPQTGAANSTGGSLGGLAAFAGINLGAAGTTGEISPNLYPLISSSVRFRVALMQSKIRPSAFDHDITYAAYYDLETKQSILSIVKKYTIGLPGTILSALSKSSDIENTDNEDSNDKYLKLNLKELRNYERIGSQMQVVPDKRDGFITITFAMNDPYLSAQMAKNAEVLLQKEILGFRQDRAKEQLNFIEGRFNLKKAEYENIRGQLALFMDRNNNISTAVV